ncbi:hypothetical protein JCM11641_002421 [Rhodosporidiobolus odoratus]
MSTHLDSDTSPGRSMNDLPFELKAKIVALAAEQDAQFKPRMKELQDAGLKTRSSSSTNAEDWQQRKRYRGQSLAALFEVSRDFAALVAPYRFRVVKLGVLPSTAPPSAQYAAFSIPRISGIVELECHDLPTADCVPFIRVFKELRILRLNTLRPPENPERLILALRSLSSLEELHLGWRSGCHSNRFSGTTFSPVPPSLKHLCIAVCHLKATHLTFAAMFVSTLSSLFLSVACTSGHTGGTPPLFSNETFAKVEQLRIAGDHEVLHDTLASIEPRHFPSLARLELAVSGADWVDDSPLHTFTPFPSLTHLHITNYTSLAAHDRDVIAKFCHDNVLELS